MAALEYWIWLSAASVSPRAKAALIEHYGDAEAAYYAPKGVYALIPGITAQEAERLEKRDRRAANKILGACEEQNLSVVTYQDAAYPKRLKNIFAPPVVLYAKGKLPDVDSEALISVIGTRKASYYGQKMGRDLAYQICKGGGTVVSLLTNGVDAEAARGALLADGKCVAVLGTSHEAEKGYLAQELAVRGALISEYPPGTRSQRQFFRERNRIAAGLSVGVLVVEAPARSGTRLFASEALEQGKELFAVPGNVDAENCAGCLEMIQNGAKLVTCGWDVLEEFEGLFPGKLQDGGRESAPLVPKLNQEKPPEPPTAEKKDVDKENEGDYIDLREQLAGLSADELAVVTAIEKQSSHVDDIIAKTGLPTAAVLRVLTLLTIKKYVKRNPGNYYSLNITKK